MRIHLSFLLVATFALADPKSLHDLTADANRFLSSGDYLEAARTYSQVIQLDPSSYLNYYKRATAYLSLGRNNQALEDLDAILELNPSFSQAYWQKAKILAQEGEFDRALETLRQYGKSGDPEAKQMEERIHIAAEAQRKAIAAEENQQWAVCVDEATQALTTSPNSIPLRELRIRCSEETGNVMSVHGDLSRLAALNPSSISIALRLSHISYFLLASTSALQNIKQCLHYDPDSRPCKRAHKLIRSFDKDITKVRNFVEGSMWRQAIKVLDGSEGLIARFEAVLEMAQEGQDGFEPYIPRKLNPGQHSQLKLEIYALACKAAVGADHKKGYVWCEETLRLDENNVDALVGQGEKLLKEEQWEEAVRSLELAFEKSGRSSQDILNRLQKAQKLLKISKQKDYYKILGVRRDADDRTIKKAFRKAAKTAHPDVGGTQEKMQALNEAYETLIDPELRKRYDNGDDPNDPTSNQQQNPFAHHGGAPFQFFQQGGFPGAGQGYQFHFGGGGGGPKMPGWG
ncbi:hypothetical protein TREMEDRAFT_44445 [Tremella mesenterica DSM 1558]|uniref:uncharacterized protein n=1 Tax=Tremella mesenterica (strain ATCC 24925 / CBS 8224 / DSM 1558 / NBRC 9311 / NRRL Y-6157 / RJB 2259-6 / UBC 559-6) TaxID=578456 RepID=UPI0003F4A64A|nr:uncharacterized protein TREMEDRAFT_44445 [Tremella mesenterica DSM 1558]EIW68583.1 hypothetical protein TREMEDRAFT_44445 [Tremella mesenterica DSM 1558]